MNTQSRTAFITGGGSGIGAACALRLAEDGYRVLIGGRQEKNLKQISTRHDRIDYLVFDVTRQRDVDGLPRVIEQRLGHLDVLVNNAGIARFQDFETTTPADLDEIFATNVRGLLAVSQACLPLLKKARGNIVNISSIAANRPMATMFAYSASKAAVDNMTRSMAQALAASGVRVNAVSPGPIETPIFDKQGFSDAEKTTTAEQITSMVPLGRFGQSDEVAGVVAFLASDQAGYVTGANYSVDGGLLA